MIFTINRDLVSCVIYNGLQTTLQAVVPRDHFLASFIVPLTEDILFVSVEFDKNMFHLTDSAGLHVYETVSEHPVTQFFADNKDQLSNWFLDQENMANKPSAFHTYDTTTHSWVLSVENKILLDSETARKKRNTLLAQSDWTQVLDVLQAVKDQWTSYRQALRDIPQQSGFPNNIVWPTKPA